MNRLRPRLTCPAFHPRKCAIPNTSLDFFDQIRLVQLTDGQYQEGAPGGTDYISVSMTDFIARGDLNGDGENEAVAIVAENYGGSGTFVFLVVYQYMNDKAIFLTSIFLDDRPMINALAVEDGEDFCRCGHSRCRRSYVLPYPGDQPALSAQRRQPDPDRLTAH